jgi:hypothetical protein
LAPATPPAGGYDQKTLARFFAFFAGKKSSNQPEYEISGLAWPRRKSRLRSFENVVPVISAIDDVINRSWILNAKPGGPRHQQGRRGRARYTRLLPILGLRRCCHFQQM